MWKEVVDESSLRLICHEEKLCLREELKQPSLVTSGASAVIPLQGRKVNLGGTMQHVQKDKQCSP